jgi:hypothetical protein
LGGVTGDAIHVPSSYSTTCHLVQGAVHEEAEVELQHEKDMELELRHEIQADEATISTTRKMLFLTMVMLFLSVFLNFGMTW